VNKLIKRLKKHAFAYFKAINNSVQCSEDGIIFCMDAISLREFLGKQETKQDILEFICEMQKRAKKAHQCASRTVDAFTNVHREIGKVSLCPRVLDLIKTTHKRH